MAERIIAANTTEAHTIVVRELVRDMREVLDMCSTAWFVIALLVGVDALTAALDLHWIKAALLAALTGFAAWSALDFHRRARKYRTRRYEGGDRG